MSLVIYVREDCHDCDKVLAYINGRGLDIGIDDIDNPKDPEAPRLFAAPALCDGPRLLAYGIDIIAVLDRIG
ncbi:MAG: hypothetical protein IPG74_15755 [Flavobacteriales bacterium]|nr:hypothetical protein [Flavobacteriales bacterium]MBK7554066.1 hypothetical protein [Flavobacteriales bacterium]MBK9196457.1 hypothetical protein [Flavobacteriales bacterium]MBP6573568.1 hypothetical protein [Flavobacteriales bacterium]